MSIPANTHGGLNPDFTSIAVTTSVSLRDSFHSDARLKPPTDRQNISAARLANFEADLNLTDTNYQLAVSILFVGYVSWHFTGLSAQKLIKVTCKILFQVPSNIIAAKVKYTAVYINLMMSIWGVLSACTGAVHSFGPLLVVRIL